MAMESMEAILTNLLNAENVQKVKGLKIKVENFNSEKCGFNATCDGSFFLIV